MLSCRERPICASNPFGSQARSIATTHGTREHGDQTRPLQCHLQPRSIQNLELCLTMDRHPEVTRFVAGPWDDPIQHERFVRERISRNYGDGLGYWTIIAKDDPGRFLGWVMLVPHNEVGPDVEIGWRLNRAAWGKGYGSEAAGLMITYASRTQSIKRIVADIHPENLRSIRLAEKIGLRPITTIEDFGSQHRVYAVETEPLELGPKLGRSLQS